MKAVKIIVGTLAAAYTIVACLRLIEVMTTGNSGEVNLMASIVPPAIGGAIALAAFQSAFKKDTAAEEPTEGGE